MEWRDTGILLSARPHGESAAILDIFTAGHGRHAGVLPGGGSRKMAGILQPGAQLDLEWRARLEDHIGTWRVEPTRSRGPRRPRSRSVRRRSAGARSPGGGGHHNHGHGRGPSRGADAALVARASRSRTAQPHGVVSEAHARAADGARRAQARWGHRPFTQWARCWFHQTPGEMGQRQESIGLSSGIDVCYGCASTRPNKGKPV